MPRRFPRDGKPVRSFGGRARLMALAVAQGYKPFKDGERSGPVTRDQVITGLLALQSEKKLRVWCDSDVLRVSHFDGSDQRLVSLVKAGRIVALGKLWW